jgi:acetylornithine/N-succinyldiaminopimelate aminotransferase
VKELRVCGLMIGLELTIDGAALVQKCLDRGLLINCTQQTVIRLLPAMTLSDDQVDEGCETLAKALRDHSSSKA